MHKFYWLTLLALSGLFGWAYDANAQRMGAVGGGRAFNPGLGGSVSYGGNRSYNPGFSAGYGSVAFNASTYRNNQGLQPSQLRVPFTYTPGYQWYNGRLPYGYWGGAYRGIPYYQYNNFWYRSMWFRGMPYYIPVPINTVPEQVQKQWEEWYKLQQEQIKKALEKK